MRHTTGHISDYNTTGTHVLVRSGQVVNKNVAKSCLNKNDVLEILRIIAAGSCKKLYYKRKKESKQCDRLHRRKTHLRRINEDRILLKIWNWKQV